MPCVLTIHAMVIESVPPILIPPATRPYRVLRALCLDFDGTVRGSRSGAMFGPTCPDDVMLLPGVERRLHAEKAEGRYLIGISNQGVIGYGTRTDAEVRATMEATVALFTGGNPFDAIYYCPALAEVLGGKAPYQLRSLHRKPGVGMLARAEWAAYEQGASIDWDLSLFVGDRPEDEATAAAAGIPFAWAHDFFGWGGRGVPRCPLRDLEASLAELDARRARVQAEIDSHPDKQSAP